MLVCVFVACFARETAGAARIRHSLPPHFSGDNDPQTSGNSRREIADAYLLFEIRIKLSQRHCEERSCPPRPPSGEGGCDEAIHSHQAKKEWIASRSLSSGAHSRDPVALRIQVQPPQAASMATGGFTARFLAAFRTFSKARTSICRIRSRDTLNFAARSSSVSGSSARCRASKMRRSRSSSTSMAAISALRW
jgi:hypothetical protein